MGYRSDVLIAIAFKTKTQRDEIWAAYCIDPRVQKYGLAGVWKNSNEDEFTPILYYYQESIKWYESSEDVQGIEHMRDVAEQFEEHRGMPFAWLRYRIGEELTDVEVEEYHTDDGGEDDLIGELWQRANIERRIDHSF
jgi:hypothetical protein